MVPGNPKALIKMADPRRYIDPERAFLVELGVTDAQARIIPAMARRGS